jgi:uncharacterized protein (TIGR01777 family)
MKILVTGGTGFIGKELVNHLAEKYDEIIIFTRNSNLKNKGNITYTTDLSIIDSNKEINVIINLAGANISQRWTESYKKLLMHSRYSVTKSLITLIKRLKKKPDLLINASAIGYYGDQNGNRLDELSVYVNDYTHQLCQEWEEKALRAENFGVRVCVARLGVVFGKNGGALEKITTSLKFGFGVILGDGHQLISWVHMHDVISAFEFFINNKQMNGFYNIVSPHSISNKHMMKILGKIFDTKILFKMPSFLVKILFGEMGEKLLLASSNIAPTALTKAKFKFKYHHIEQALIEIYGKK